MPILQWLVTLDLVSPGTPLGCNFFVKRTGGGDYLALGKCGRAVGVAWRGLDSSVTPRYSDFGRWLTGWDNNVLPILQGAGWRSAVIKGSTSLI